MPTTSSVSEGSSITAAPWHQLLDLRNCRIQRFPKSSKSPPFFWRFHKMILEFFDFLDLLVANFLSKDVSICGFLEANLTPLETSEYLNFNRDLENRKNGGEWWELVKWDSWKPCLFFYSYAWHNPTSSLLLSLWCHCCWVSYTDFSSWFLMFHR